MKITVLAENTTVSPDYESEHGLSLYIETNNKKILFDMGQTNLFAENAKKLGVDLADVDIAVISHGHYDHGGGLETFLQLNTKAPIYINKNAFLEFYNGTNKYIGLDQKFSKETRLAFCDDMFKIDKNLFLYTCNDRSIKYGDISVGLTVKNNGVFQPDRFVHEQYLYIMESGKRYLISGCSHKGVLDIVNWFSPDVFIGGFHYNKMMSDSKLAERAMKLNKMNIKYYTCHCTGVEQYEYMKKFIADLDYISTGTTIMV